MADGFFRRNAYKTKLIDNGDTTYLQGVAVLKDLSGSTATSTSASVITVDSAITPTTIVDENINRMNLLIQNQGTVPIIIKAGGTTPSTSDYNFVLAPSTALRQGDGAVYTTTTFKGTLKGIVETSTSVISVHEEVEL